jgi:hypothetical protein
LHKWQYGVDAGNYGPYVPQMPENANNWFSNAATVSQMTLLWATGYSWLAQHTYKNDAVANAFRNASGIVQAREDYYNNGKTFGDANFGLKGLFQAGIDPVEQFVGSYHYQIDRVNDGLQFTITNQTSFGSAAYHVWPYSWNWSSGPMGNFDQTYIFAEPYRK